MKRRSLMTATAVGMTSLSGCIFPEQIDVETEYEVPEGITVSLEEVYTRPFLFEGCSVTIEIAAEERDEYWIRISGLNQDGVSLDQDIETALLYEDERRRIMSELRIHQKKLETVKVQVEPYTDQPTEDTEPL